MLHCELARKWSDGFFALQSSMERHIRSPAIYTGVLKYPLRIVNKSIFPDKIGKSNAIDVAV